MNIVDRESGKEKPKLDYTGLKIVAVLAPLLLLFIHWGKADTGVTVSLVVGAIVFAVKTHRSSRKYVWFWPIIVFIFFLHVPLFIMIRWPHGEVPGVFYGIPFAYADYLIISKTLDLAERILLKSKTDK